MGMIDGEILEPGATPPGRYVAREDGLRVWEGEARWRTRHGEAVVDWFYGQPSRVEQARCADGRTDVETLSPIEHETWRRRRPEGEGHIHGTLAIEADDVVFTDTSREPFAPYPQGASPSLQADLSRDPAFLERIRADRAFAVAVYGSMCNARFRKGMERKRWGRSWRGAAGLVAEMRDLGESYIDFYLSDLRDEDDTEGPADESALRHEVLAHYARLGWRLVGSEEEAADAARALAELEAYEAAPQGPCPAWAEAYIPREARGPVDRAIMAARAGKVPQEALALLIEELPDR